MLVFERMHQRATGLEGVPLRSIDAWFSAEDYLCNVKASDAKGRQPAAPALTALSTFLLFVGTGLCLLVLTPPAPASAAGGSAVPSDSTCVRVARAASYVAALVPMGSPAVQRSLLLRLDTALAADSPESAMRLTTQEILKSENLECTPDGDCEDLVLMSRGTDGDLERFRARFTYDAAGDSGVAGALGLEGEMFLRANNSYWITASHLCTMSLQPSAPAPLVGQLVTSSTAAMAPALVDPADSLVYQLGDAPALSLPDSCANQSIELFPMQAAHEASWLSLSTPATEERRATVERGTHCLGNHSTGTSAGHLSTPLALYKLDCTAWCRETPSVPFKRVADASMRIDVHPQGGGYQMQIALHRETVLSEIVGMGSTSEQAALASIRLIMVCLAALIAFVRSHRSSSSAVNLLLAARGAQPPQDTGKATARGLSQAEDLAVCIAAFVARAVIAGLRLRVLTADGQVVAVCTEIAGAAASVLLFIGRYTMQHETLDATQRLGGTTALVDSVCSVLVAFTTTPLLTSSDRHFDSTARLLVALLITTMIAPRIAVSATACSVGWLAECNTQCRAVWAAAALLWVYQSVSVAIAAANLFAAPLLFASSRAYTGSRTEAAALLWLVLVATGLPRLNRISTRLAASTSSGD